MGCWWYTDVTVITTTFLIGVQQSMDEFQQEKILSTKRTTKGNLSSAVTCQLLKQIKISRLCHSSIKKINSSNAIHQLQTFSFCFSVKCVFLFPTGLHFLFLSTSSVCFLLPFINLFQFSNMQ